MPIFGEGTAGLAAERNTRGAGATIILIDDRFAGTTCATVGCMPSNLLIAAGQPAHVVRSASIFAIGTQAPVIDGIAVMSRVRRERHSFTVATIGTIDDIPSGIRGNVRACFIDAATLALGDGRRVFAAAVVIATGLLPYVPEMFALLGARIPYVPAETWAKPFRLMGCTAAIAKCVVHTGRLPPRRRPCPRHTIQCETACAAARD